MWRPSNQTLRTSYVAGRGQGGACSAASPLSRDRAGKSGVATCVHQNISVGVRYGSLWASLTFAVPVQNLL